MASDTRQKLSLGHQFRSREARDHFKAFLETAERGEIAVVLRDSHLVLLRRDVLESVIAASAPLVVKSAVTDDQFAFWLDGVPVHAVGADLDEAEAEFLDALVDYAELWFDELQLAPNHAPNRNLALRVAMYAGDRDELRRVVFGD